MSTSTKVLKSKVASGFVAGLKQYAAQLIFLAAIFIFLSIKSEVFLRADNLINVSRQIACNMYMGCALTMVFTSGGIDLSTSSVMAFAGMIAALLSIAGLPFWICAVVALISGMICGAITGTILANTGLPPFIVTYAMKSALRGIVYVATGAASLRLTNPQFLEFGGGSLGALPYPVIYMIGTILITFVVMKYTKLGRHMYAMGGNKKAAEYSGIDVKKIRVFVYVVSGFCAALAGLVYTSRNCSLQPSLGEGGTEMDAIAAAVLGGTSMGGGRGSVVGTVIGAFIIGFINNGLNLLGINSFYQYIAKGLIILLAVYLDDIKTRKLLAGAAK